MNDWTPPHAVERAAFWIAVVIMLAITAMFFGTHWIGEGL